MPLRDWTVDGFEALLTNVKLALADPPAFGVNVTVKDVDWPAGTVRGRVIPDSTNSPLLLVAEETVTAAPEALRLALSVELEPTVTVPKLRLAGETES